MAFRQGTRVTPSDFGLRSDPPSHPELLDYLARDFINPAGRSRRCIAGSCSPARTSRAATRGPTSCARDPENRLLWRFNRQRLDFESMRDSVLAVAGSLDATIGGPAVADRERPVLPRRTLYGFIDRQNLDGVYRTFDFAVPDATSPRRFVTTVPQQALFLMNSPFLHEQARRLAGAIAARDVEPGADPGEDRSAASIAACWADLPETDELALATAFLSRQSRRRRKPARPRHRAAALAWEQLSQVLLLTNEFMFVD